ncbi:putative NUDIX family NTP pyrophosphohydrolase [Prauserella isguenensis]|uniref:Putative NUDIX family NTP pyrophosphohydrolase n=1 Tax=Prauserella isguenensis TaxID=1470180 RepID=A0A839S091_9PSEU|nr:putative NUDIX family NTP pyrophosphohydrolase [Prauserella isguenensis]
MSERRRSAGILLYRRGPDAPEVLIGHMGGPFWARREEGAWTIPKGEYAEDEQPEAAAYREFEEELGVPAPEGGLIALGDVRQSGGKVVTAWALEGDLDPGRVTPGTFELEWPRGSGRMQVFPELDRVEWCALDAARARLVTAQRVLLDRLVAALAR